jgi:four helix bundle protein
MPTANPKSNDLRGRTFAFALAIIEFTETLPRSRTADVIGKQLLRAGTSVGANYRSVKRAQSPAHMISKLSLVEEEADECGYWLELLRVRGIVTTPAVAVLEREASELTAIMVASKKTLRAQARTSSRHSSRFVVRSSDGES